jgi:RHS repeat-associated protein
VDYVYDLVGKIQSVNDPTGAYSFAYDNMGRLIGTTTSYSFLPGRTFTTSYTYDKASNRTGFTDPENGSTTYAYDSLNRLQTLTPPAAFTTGNFGFSYDALSRRTQMTRPNNVTTNYAYDNLSRLTSVLHQLAGSTIDGATYILDNAGNRTAKTDQRTAVATSYGYDNIYQLLSATQGATTTESYAYDAVGNRTSSLGVASYTTNSSNEMTANSNASYGYDYNGNTTTKTDSTGTTNYTWDFENRLTSVTLPGSGGTVSFKYDPFGRRVYKSSTSGTSIYAYDQDNLIEETNGSGAVVARYTQTDSIDEPVAILRAGTTSFYQADGLGSVTSLSNTAGALAQTYTFDSFGNLTASSGSLSNPFRFTGREFDSETSLYFYRARHFDPAIGRFLSEDPMRFFESPNFYPYVENNPLNLIDTTGLQAERPGNLPLGTPQQYWGPFSDGFNEALNRLNNARCAEQFEPSCHEGPYNTGPNQMRNTTYRFLNLGSPSTGASTADATNVFINTTGLYMTAKGGGIRLPNGFRCNLGNVTNVRAFILLHELGHQLKGNTGFTTDVDDAATNSAHSMRIIKACFQCQ